MLGTEFRGLAETVTRTYGDDPWFFLRELAQNSRDACARSIRVDAETTPEGMETLTFADDGHGMTLDHARSFLFRLYASDKDGDQAAAGRYGIGFWTILRFQPSEIYLQSRCGRHSWAVTLDAGLNARPAACRLARSGTTVTLSRTSVFPSAGDFSSQVEKGLRTYCCYLRRNDRRGSMLPLWFAGKNLTVPMALPGPLSLSFRSGPVEGVVAVGVKPMVRLYARGLPVWQGAVLNQMSLLQADADLKAEIGRGLAPVFLLNGNHLDVTFSRNQAVENKALGLVLKKAEAALHRLLESSLEQAFPRKWHQRFHDRLRDSVTRMRRPGWHWLPVILLVLVPLEFVAMRQWFSPPAHENPLWFSLRDAPMSYRGATVGISRAAAGPPFSYQPERPAWFKLFSADAFDVRNGFIRGTAAGRRPLPAAPACQETKAHKMKLQTDAGGETLLPLAPGHSVLPGSLLLNGRRMNSGFATVQGEAIVAVPDGGGTLEYRSCPSGNSRELTAAEISLFTSLPEQDLLPPDLEADVLRFRSAPVLDRAAQALAIVKAYLAYDTSPAIAESYQQAAPGATWLDNVLRIKRGDCDIINGFHVLLLRMMGVPSRLVIGMVGDRGRVHPQFHAWSEYFDQGWMVCDASFLTAGAKASNDMEYFPATAHGQAAPAVGSAQGRPSFFTNPAGPFLFLLLLVAGGGLSILLVRKQREKGTLLLDGATESPLLLLVQHALLQPSAWGTDNPLWRHRILPVIGSTAVSIDQARRLQRQRKLFTTGNRNPLALAMAASGMSVLDLSQPSYVPLRTLLSGAIDTDQLCRLRPEPPAAGSLIASVNTHLSGRLGKAPPCLLAPDLCGVDLISISLPVPLRNAPFFFPQRFIAVHPEGKTFAHYQALYSRNQDLAVLRFLRRLDSEGLLPGASGPALVKRAARRLMLNAHE